MIFEPVWVSSVEHLLAFEKSFREASYLRRLLGAYLLPDGFPYTRGWLGFPWRIPVVMFSSGRLRIGEHVLDFEATAWHPPFNRLHHMRTDWKFTLTAPEVSAIEPFESVSPVLRYYSLPFTRIRTNKGGDLADFLLCVGGSGPLMGRIRERNVELSARIREAFPGAMQTQSVSPST
jgi:hypothetical protein